MWQGLRYPPTKLPALPVPRALPNPLALPATPAGLAPAPCQEARRQNEPPRLPSRSNISLIPAAAPGKGLVR